MQLEISRTHLSSHSRLSETEKHEFIHLVHQLYPSVYTTILTQLALNNRMLDSQARMGHSKEFKQSVNYKRHPNSKRTKLYEKNDSEDDDDIRVQFESDQDEDSIIKNDNEGESIDGDLSNKDNQDNAKEDKEEEAIFENEDNQHSSNRNKAKSSIKPNLRSTNK